MLFLVLLAAPVLAQEFDANFEKMLFEVNRNRFDKALVQLFPVQSAIQQKAGGKPPKLDETMRTRMGQMRDATAVLSTIALLKTQLAGQLYEDAQGQAMLVGMGLSGLWSQLPAYQKLNYAKEDLAEALPDQRQMELKKLGYAAVDAGEWATAKKSAAELIGIAEKKDFIGPDPGTWKHSALTIRGLAELGMGDLPGAEKTLVESMKVRGESMMRMTGPSFRLANELLAKGRKQAVDQFLALVVGSVWRDSSKAEQWRQELAAGKMPDLPGFSSN